MKRSFDKILASKFWWLMLPAILFVINYLASVIHARFDLTKEKRYTLSKTTKGLLRNLDGKIQIDVFLKGEFTAEFRKLANTVEEFLQESKEYSYGKLQIRFIDPLKNLDDSAAAYLIDSIGYYYDISPYTLQAPGKIGDEMKQKIVLPGAVIHYKDTSVGVNLLKGMRTYGAERDQIAKLYNDIEGTLEYKFASAIQKITSIDKPLVGYALGHGEVWGFNADDAVKTLFNNYRFDTVNIKTDLYIPSDFKAVVIMKPTIPFTDEDKLKIDQYVMRGGNIFWMVDNMYAEFDSLYQSGGFTAYDRALNLEDILFKYGARINQNLLQDMQCDKLPQVIGKEGEGQQKRLVDWPFFPVLNGTNHPISKNLDGVRAIFPNTIDTIKAEGIKKSFLLRSSSNARVLPAPAIVDFEFLQIAPDIERFTVHDAAVAVLLEGKFTSLFKNIVSTAQLDSLNNMGIPFMGHCSQDTKMIVVADGDIATNQYSQTNGPLPMGVNLFTKYTFANKEFFINSVEYLVNPSNLLETRAKNFTLRLLNPVKVKDQKTTWQFINIALPIAAMLLFGFIYQQIRKRKYAA
jgi:gliding-associated putative ABC transporter substrate-binding component GldG